MAGPLRRLIPGCRLLIKQQFSQPQTRTYFFRRGGNWDPFSEVQTSIREMEKNFDRMERDMNRFWNGWGFPRFNSPFCRRLPGEISASDGKVHKIQLDLDGYKPEDVKVTVKDRMVTVEARMEHKGSDGSRLYQEQTRQFTLPENVDMENLKSLFSSQDGLLSIEAPLIRSQAAVESGTTEIPISRDSSDTTSRQG